MRKKLKKLKNADAWVFDLDNTLYPSSCNLFHNVDVRITEFIVQELSLPFDEARKLQKKYFHQYGTTLKGLMVTYNFKPEKFLDFVHEIDYSPLFADPALSRQLENINKPLYIFTNGTKSHAKKVLKNIGIDHHLFQNIIDITNVDYTPKPHEESFKSFFELAGLDPKNAVMVEDIAKNLLVPHAYGMHTVWVENMDEYGVQGSDGNHIHYRTKSLSHFLENITAV